MHQSSKEKENFVAPGGSNTIVKHFLSEAKSEFEIKLETGVHLKTLRMSNNFDESSEFKINESSKQTVEAETKCGKIETFDFVFLTIPPPQILTDIEFQPEIEPEIRKKLEKVKFSSRYALIKYFDPQQSENFKNVEKFEKYMAGYEKGRIRYWSKIHKNSILFHSDINFGESLMSNQHKL